MPPTGRQNARNSCCSCPPSSFIDTTDDDDPLRTNVAIDPAALSPLPLLLPLPLLQAKVVIASLVRSNAEARIGFLREPERLNVLLSRARDGMVIIGNSETFTAANNTGQQKCGGTSPFLPPFVPVHPLRAESPR